MKIISTLVLLMTHFVLCTQTSNATGFEDFPSRDGSLTLNEGGFIVSIMEKEIWKDVGGYEGYYMVSSIGNIKGLSRRVASKNKSTRIVRGRIFNLCVNAYGYPYFLLRRKGSYRVGTVHRIVALAFIPNPGNKRTVNHINGIKTDNRVENLEWATYAENNKHASDIGIRKHYAGCTTALPIVQYDMEGNFIKEWESGNQAAISLKINNTSIGKCCKGKSQTAGGFKWKYPPIKAT